MTFPHHQADHDSRCLAAACRRRPTPPWRLCTNHGTKTGQWLAELEDLYATLDTTPSTTATWRTSGGTLASERAPARVDVLVLRDPRSRERDPSDPDGNHGRGVLEVLHAWARLVREERDLTPPAGPATVASERAVLATHLDWALAQDWCDELHADLRAIHGQLTAAHGIARARPVGRCPTLIDTGECGGPLWADDDHGHVTCGTCARTFTPAELRHLGEMLIGSGYVEVFRAEWFTGVPAPTIRRWASEGRLDVERDGRRLLVRITDVEALRDRKRRAETTSA